MPFNMDTREDESYDKVGSGFKRLPAGRYHAEIVDVDETFQQSEKLIMTFEVLNGTIPNQAGQRHTEYFSCSEKAMDRLKRLAMVCDLIRPGEVKDITFNDAKGKTLVIEIVPHSYTNASGKEVQTTQLDFGGFWKEDHPDVKDVPRGSGGGGSSASGGGGSPQPDPSPAPSGSGSSWDNI